MPARPRKQKGPWLTSPLPEAPCSPSDSPITPRVVDDGVDSSFSPTSTHPRKRDSKGRTPAASCDNPRRRRDGAALSPLGLDTREQELAANLLSLWGVLGADILIRRHGYDTCRTVMEEMFWAQTHNQLERVSSMASLYVTHVRSRAAAHAELARRPRRGD